MAIEQAMMRVVEDLQEEREWLKPYICGGYIVCTSA